MIVKLIDHMGTDVSVVNTARASFGKDSEYEIVTEGEDWEWVMREADVKLINYLARHNHWTPFAHTCLSFRIKAPIFVARQLAKHQVGLVWNEESRRYIDTEPEFYMPEIFRAKAENVKQGSKDEAVTSLEAWDDVSGDRWEWDDPVEFLHMVNCHNAEAYKFMLASGICPEQARMVLPQNTMTTWVWTGSLYAFHRVCKLRLDSHTQAETREVAKQIAKQAESYFPVSWKALSNG